LKTTIQLINEVGKNLARSDGTTYTTLTQDRNAISILQAINEAKREVEDGWKWDSLRTAITFDSVGGTHDYDLGDGGVATSSDVTTDRSYIIRDKYGRVQMWDVTDDSEFQMTEVSTEYAESFQELEDTTVARPNLVSFRQNGDGISVRFPFAPDGVRNYKLYCIVPQDDLAATDTVLLAPWRPVVLKATVLALEERGDNEARIKRFERQYLDALGKAISHSSDEYDFTLVAV